VTGALVVAFGLLVGPFALSAYSDLRPSDAWRDRDGKPVPETKVSSHAGPEHCDWQSVTSLELEAGSGLTGPALSGRITFLRDPEGKLGDSVLSPYDAGAELPRGAVDSGWARDGHELWLDPDGWAAYLQVEGDEFERWPRTSGVISCA